MADMRRKRFESNGKETIIDNDGILWLNEKHIEEGLNQKILQQITTNYNWSHRKHKYELVEESKK